MGNTTSKPNKFAALITYCIALVCLLLGLLLPFGNVEGVEGKNAMLLLQLPGAINSVFGTELSFAFCAENLTYGFPIQFMGLGEKAFDIGAVFVLLYAVIAVVGLIALIPVIASNRNSATALKTASVIEALALVFVTPLVFFQLEDFMMANLFGWNKWSYALLIAFGGTLLMLVIQAIIYRKGSGVIKFVLLLVSAVAVLTAVFDITVYVTALADPVKNLADTLKASGGLSNGEFGIAQLFTLFSADYFAAVKELPALEMTFNIIALVLSILVVVNFMLDMLGLAKKTNRGMLIANIVRYALEVIAIALMIIFTFFIDNVTCGIMLYLLAVVAVIALVINIIRTCTYKTDKERAADKAAANAEKAASEAEKAKQADEVRNEKEDRKAAKEAKRREKEERKAAKAAAKQNPAAAPAPVAQTSGETAANSTFTYNVGPIYNGPIDDFIKKLTNSERIEFAQVFLERKKGYLPNIPDYVVGGRNTKFFSSVFVYYGRIRDYVSDGLINKMYEQGNMMY